MAQDMDRPAVLYDLSASQMEEIYQQSVEDDRAGFDRRADAYGWSADQADEVWSWMARPRVLLELLDPQLAALRRHFIEGDRASFDADAANYGWTADEANEVWVWLSRRVVIDGDLEAASP